MIKSIDEEGIGEILKSEKFVVPLHQRSFSWKTDAYEFFDDIMKINDKEEEYFIGPMVFQPCENFREVIDGQQRLVTTCLIITSIRDLCKIHDIKDPLKPNRNLGEKIHNLYLIKSTTTYQPEELSLQPNKIDRELFKLIVETEGPFDEKEKTIKAFLNKKKYLSWKLMWDVYLHIFKKLDEEIKELDATDAAEFVNNIIKTLDEKIRVISIIVDTDADAYLVFETLNSKGLQLAPVDLIKNHLFNLIKNEKEIERYDVIWSSFLNELDNSRELTMLIRYYIIYEYEFVREKYLFKYIRKEYNTKKKAKDFIATINKFFDYYRHIKSPSRTYWNNDELVDWLEDLNKLKLSQHIPILFALIEKYPDKKEIKKLLKPLYYLMLRRSIVRKSPSEFEKKLEDLCQSIKNGEKGGYKSLIKNLDPENSEVEENLQKYEFVDTKQKHLAKILLRILNNKGSPETKTNHDLTLEHILPQSKQSELKDKYLVNTIGNFTLLLEGMNIKCSDDKFSTKVNIYKKSKLHINKDLVDNYTSWNENDIKKRTKELSKKVSKTLKI